MTPKPIRSFARGLAVLSALNRHGSATALTLARECGVPRATVYRLLQTLVEVGYISRGTADEKFHLQLKVRNLSEGFANDQWISTIARPALEELTRRISYPCDVVTLAGLKMVIQETTHRVAPLSIDRNMIGQELPILASASGLAYIAFAPKQERSTLLELLARSSDPNDALARRIEQVSSLLAATRRRGYAIRHGGKIWPHTGAIALPIRAGPRLLGVINTIWMARAITAEQAIKRCLGPLHETQAEIERRLTEARRGA